MVNLDDKLVRVLFLSFARKRSLNLLRFELCRDNLAFFIFLRYVVIEHKVFCHVTLDSFLHKSKPEAHYVEQIVIKDNRVEFHIL
jgi:hypothetical protein